MRGLSYQSSDIINNKLKLSSIISGDNLIYGISSSETNKLLSFKELPYLEENFYLNKEKLSTIFKNIEQIRDIDEICIALLNPEFVFCPAELYSPDSDSQLLKAVSIKQYLEDYSIQNKFIPELNSYLIYIVPTVLKEFLNKSFKTVKYYHANEIFLSAIKFIDNNNNLLIANINNSFLQTAIFKEGKFLQTNVYEIQNKEDILYYIISNLTNHGIPVNIAKVLLSGRLEKKSAIFNLLSEHIKNIGFIDSINRRHFSNVFLGKPRHLFFDIFALSQCES